MRLIILILLIILKTLGECNKTINLLLEGYNHILDLNTDKDILKLPLSRGHTHVSVILQSIPTFEVSKIV